VEALQRHCGIADGDQAKSINLKWYQVLQEVTLEDDAAAPCLRSLLGVHTEMEACATLSAPALRARTFAALWQFHRASSTPQPLVLEIENLHWIDATSEEYLTTLAERLAGVPILLLLT
jgi:predicted ATPase